MTWAARAASGWCPYRVVVDLGDTAQNGVDAVSEYRHRINYLSDSDYLPLDRILSMLGSLYLLRMRDCGSKR